MQLTNPTHLLQDPTTSQPYESVRGPRNKCRDKDICHYTRLRRPDPPVRNALQLKRRDPSRCDDAPMPWSV
nr:hypothetical protein CFP56_50454 [Quercus suber]